MGVGLIVDAEEVAEEIIRVASESATEEDLRQGVEYVLKRRVIEKLKEVEGEGVPHASWQPPRARYEVTLVSGVRADALYGHLIIEYERPKTFDTKSGFEKAVEQVKGYIIAHAQNNEARFPRYLGVVLDGYKIGFVRYRSVTKAFESKGPFEVNKNTVAKLIEAIVGLRRKALSPEDLLKDFGPESPVTRSAIKTFYGKLLNPSDRTKTLFEDWRRVFSQVCAYSPSKVKGLEKFYGLKGADPEKLLFAVHTYYALIMKLLAAEVGSLYITPRIWSYLRTLEDAYYRGHERLRDELRDLEEGGIFQKLGILNFLEADYFAWYLDEWDPEVGRAIMNVIDRLVEYDPSVADLEPERIRDLFKRLYQNLVPKKIRHDLGEYYTPDWLAELVLNEVGWTLENFERVAEEKGDVLAPLDLRLLDPACGSGTFLILAIGRLKSYIEEHWIDKKTALRKITRNIVGFDLNPLAVIASKANYLIALGDMLRDKGAEPIEIPVYLADSILVERRQTLIGGTYVLRTAVGEFTVPISIVEKGLLAKVLSIIEECVRSGYSSNEFKTRLLREVSLEKIETSILVKLFETLSKLEKEGKNRIWIRVLRNSFAPFFVKRFHYVVGNPPWVNWENLAGEFRKTLKELYKEYGILPRNPNAQTKVDLSMIFAYRCMDRYLEDNGYFGFLINDAAFKAIAGNGFRKFKVRGVPFKVKVIHDFVAIKPFEGASNRTAMFIAEKGSPTKFPVKYVKWFKLSKKGIPQNSSLEEVLKMTRRVNLLAEPLGGYKPYEEVLPFLTLSSKDIFDKLNKVIGRSSYVAHEGANLLPAGIYRVTIMQVTDNLVLITNLAEKARRQKVDKIHTFVEKDLIFPILESADVKKWRVSYKNYGLIPHDLLTTQALPISRLKVEYPKTFAYFTKFEDVLKQRADYKSYGRGRLPYYFVYRFRDYTVSPYKVVWNQMGNKLEVAVATPVTDVYLGTKPIIPEHVIAFISTESEDEAHYVCSILNSSLVNLILQSIAKGGKNFATPEFINMINIRKYNHSDPLHKKLVELSKKAHRLVQQNQEGELRKVEEEIDKIVIQLYDLTDEEFMEIKRCLAILEGEEVEEEEADEEIQELAPELIVETPVLYEDEEQELEVKIINHYDAPIRDVKVKLLFEGRSSEKVFDEISDEIRVAFRLSGLKAGEYRATFSMEYLWEDSMRKIEKVVPIYVKRSSESKVKRSSLDELLG